MTRPRRNHLAVLGMSSRRTRATTTHCCSDDGGTVQCRGSAIVTRTGPRALTTHAVHAFSGNSDWGWPPAEPASLSWPEDLQDTANTFSRVAAFASTPILAPTPAPAPATSPATPAPPVSPPIKAQPLADAEADDDVAAILREKGLAPIPSEGPPPAQPMAARPTEPAEPAPPPEDRHAIFGQLGRAMPHANSFQLGRINIDQHLDLLEQGLAYHPPVPLPAAGARDLQDLDVLSEITALSEAAGVRSRPAEDGATFLRKVARAQGVSLARLEQAHEDDALPADDEEDEDFAATDSSAADDDAYSPFPEADDGQEEPQENDDG